MESTEKQQVQEEAVLATQTTDQHKRSIAGQTYQQKTDYSSMKSEIQKIGMHREFESLRQFYNL